MTLPVMTFATDSGNAEVPVDEAPHDRAVLEQEERRERAERQEEDERGQSLDPVHDALQERLPCRRGPARGVVGGAGAVDARVLGPALDRVDRLVQGRLDLRRLLGDAAEDDEEDQDAEREEPEEHEDRAGDPRDPAALHLRDERAGDRREDRADGDGDRDRGGQRQQPREPDEEDRHADEEPREQAEVAEPDRRGEDAERARRVDLDDVGVGRSGRDGGSRGGEPIGKSCAAIGRSTGILAPAPRFTRMKPLRYSVRLDTTPTEAS